MREPRTYDPVSFWARTRPGRLALRMGEETWTYGRLEEAVSTASVALFEQGLVSGEHVSIEFGASQGLHFAATLHALHRTGLLPVLIGERHPEPERVTLRERAHVEYALTATPEWSPPPGAKPARKPPKPLVFERRLDAPAAICFTSGTEGRARAVVLTHGNFLWSALASARNLGVEAEDLWLACLPLHHVGGLSILTRSAYYGTGVLVHERFDAAAVNAAIDQDGVTLLSLVPPMLERLLEARGDRPFPGTLRAALVGGGPIPPTLLQRAAELRLKALPTYGLTETASQIATLSPREWPRGLGTAGRPLPYSFLEIHSAEGRALGPGEEGEILVRGPMVTRGYFDEEARDAARLAGRWLRTGDIGAWDESGRLLVLDRREDRIVVGGENVSSAEVERALATHPAIAEACVVGIPAADWGQEVAAAVVFRPGSVVSLEGLREHAGRSLASFKLPRRLLVIESLPQTGPGKALRSEVRRWFANQVAGQDGA